MKPFSPSKRGLLSFISSVFDPLGLLTLSMIEAKLILQQLENFFSLGRRNPIKLK